MLSVVLSIFWSAKFVRTHAFLRLNVQPVRLSHAPRGLVTTPGHFLWTFWSQKPPWSSGLLPFYPQNFIFQDQCSLGDFCTDSLKLWPHVYQQIAGLKSSGHIQRAPLYDYEGLPKGRFNCAHFQNITVSTTFPSLVRILSWVVNFYQKTGN